MVSEWTEEEKIWWGWLIVGFFLIGIGLGFVYGFGWAIAGIGVFCMFLAGGHLLKLRQRQKDSPNGQ